MEIKINGGKKLSGEIVTQGSKNSALPILAASVLTNAKTIIHNCPKLTDIDAAIKILEYLGCIVEREGNSLSVDARNISRYNIPDYLMHEMRSSVVFLGAIIAKMSRANLSTPGGCEIGLRPIDLHLSAMRQFGVIISEDYGRLECICPQKLKGTRIALSFPSVGATENIMIAAVTAQGTTTIINAAREPEIIDLADFLNKCGAKIYGAGEGTVIIEGVKSLTGTEHNVIADRIVATTYMAAAAMTKGKIEIKDIVPSHLEPIIPVFEEMGCNIKIYGKSLLIEAPERLKRVRTVRTMPYPGFPTDAQAAIVAMTTIADGTSVIIENIFESRYKHVSELNRMGAKIKVEDRIAIVEGVESLKGASVTSPDLRGGSALVVAGLSAEGITRVSALNHIDRGYENLEENLRSVGADIKRDVENEKDTISGKK